MRRAENPPTAHATKCTSPTRGFYNAYINVGADMSTAKYDVAMYGFTRSVDEPRPYAQTYNIGSGRLQ